MTNHSPIKFINTSSGLRDYLSPLMLCGRFIVAGLTVPAAYRFANSIIGQVPDEGITHAEFFNLIVKKLPKEARLRYVTYELGKKYLLSPRSKSPLFIFIGGLAGKSVNTTYITEHLGITRVVSLDNERHNLRKQYPDQKHIFKATYESMAVFTKTIHTLMPHMVDKIELQMNDYNDFKKWCYLWEGIYITPETLKKLFKKSPAISVLSVFFLPDFEEIKKRYLLRWVSELGLKKLQKRKNIIDKYLKNIQAIRGEISENNTPIASFVIESSILEESLAAFYACLYQKLKDITDKEAPGWVEKVAKDPTKMEGYEKFLQQ
jgi:2-phosphoglycerate kinase